VLLEAVHYTFHPAWQTFLSLLSPPHITSVQSSLSAPAYFFPKDDIRFVYKLSGGACMDMGCYAISTLRQVFGTMPEDIISATPRLMPKGWDQLCDQAMKASWRFRTDDGEAVGDIDVDLAKSKYGIPSLDLPCVMVKHAETEVTTKNIKVKIAEGQKHFKVRTVTIWNHIASVMWHRIDIIDEHSIKTADGKVVKKWTFKKSRKAYVWPDELKGGDVAEAGAAERRLEGPEGEGEAGAASASPSAKVRPGKEYWSSYRYMLEEFVKRIKGRPGSGVWVSGEDSINGMVMVDQAYEKCGLPLRPTSTFS
jgi:predicted dehydrogenase